MITNETAQGCILPHVLWAMARVEFLSPKIFDERLTFNAASNITHAYLSIGQQNFYIIGYLCQLPNPLSGPHKMIILPASKIF